jgi:hypothetical protein
VTAARELQHTVGDISVRLLRAGAGESLLFLHGAGGWPGRLPLFEKLAAHYDVLVPLDTDRVQCALRQSLAAPLSEPASADLDSLNGLFRDDPLGGRAGAQVSVPGDVQRA